MFVWAETYETGIEEIDSIHRNILSEAGKLFNGSQLEKDLFVIDQIIDKLLYFSMQHRDHEIRIFREKNLPSTHEYENEFNKFINALKSYKIDIAEKLNDNISLDLLLFLKNWLICHLTVQTKALKPERN
ncbi:MAG: hypothetical protein A2W91_20180 [Bacteroidetes bacterium GWF2_38_335]|nr:MAG: hypothetical protein A2W91_20180 [Bacteroidetes bacterium GWF2_38_335]OFY79521.1 MAG: hypothetical protein A2281_13905 [Bacteroidetes bacterium RIFOXYA12_FULL_38_20]HBS86540.1 hypothetical protein [Bacteroidales bacterium]